MSGVNGHPASSYSVNSFKPLLSKLLSRPADFSNDDLRQAILHVASGLISHAQTGSFLAAMRASNILDADPAKVAVLVDVLTQLSGHVKVGGEGQVCDWTMTGGSAMSVRSAIHSVW